jgi:AraC-like DNA-binding protein
MTQNPAPQPDEGQPPDRQAPFVTGDPEQAHEFIRRAYADHTVRVGGDPEGFVFRHDYQPGDGFVLARMRHTMTVDMDAEPLHQRMIAVDRVDHGRLSFEVGRQTVSSAPDHPVLLPPAAPWRCTWDDPDVEVVTLDWAAVAGYAAGMTDTAPEQLEFTGLEPITPSLARYWITAVDHVRTVLDDPVASRLTLVRQQAFRTLTAALLSCFPNTALAAANDAQGREPADHLPLARVREVLEYLDQHAGDPVTPGDVADVADAPYRHVVESVRRHRGARPAELLWHARLRGAHRELLEADPDTGAGVAGTAARWGFTDLARFTVAYTAATGETPEETRRR